jgi:hypothetical protein
MAFALHRIVTIKDDRVDATRDGTEKSAGALSEQPPGRRRGTERGESYEQSPQSRLRSIPRREYGKTQNHQRDGPRLNR